MQNRKQVLFRVLAGGHEYIIYDTGETRGFPENPIIVNHYRALLARAKRVLQREIQTRPLNPPQMPEEQDNLCH